MGALRAPSTPAMVVSDRQVTSLKARLSSDGSVSGVSAWGRGFPYRVWLVKYPSADSAQFVFGDASGREVGHLAVSGNAPLPTRPRSGGITVFHYPAGVVDAKAGSMVAYLIDGRVDYS